MLVKFKKNYDWYSENSYFTFLKDHAYCAEVVNDKLVISNVDGSVMLYFGVQEVLEYVEVV